MAVSGGRNRSVWGPALEIEVGVARLVEELDAASADETHGESVVDRRQGVFAMLARARDRVCHLRIRPKRTTAPASARDAGAAVS